MKPLRALLLRNTVASWLSYGVSVLASLVLVPPLLGAVGADAYGAWVFVLQLTVFAGVFDLGVQPAVTKMVAEALGRGDGAKIRRVTGTAFLFHSGTAVVVLGGFLLMAPALIGGDRMPGVQAAQLFRAYMIAAVAAVLSFPLAVLSASLKGALRFDLVAWGNLVSQAVRAACYLWIIRTGGGVLDLALANLAASLANLALVAAAVLAQRSTLPFSPGAFSRGMVGRIVRFGLFSLLGQAGWYMAYASNAVIIGFMLTPADVAYYGIVGNVMAMLSGVAGALTGNMMPVVAAQLARGEIENSRRAYLLSTRFSLVLALPVVAVLVVLGPDLMTIWLGSSFGGPAGAVLQILALAYLFPIAGGAAPQIALGAGQERKMARISITEGLVGISASLFLIRTIGLIGAPIGTLISASLIHGVVWPRAVQKRLDLDLQAIWRESVRPTVGPLLATAPVLTFAVLLRSPERIWVPLTAAPAVLAAFACTAWFTCFNQGEREYWMKHFGLNR